MAIHIGQIIKRQLKTVGMNKAEFARRINRTPQNVYDIFGRQSLDTKLLIEIGRVLNHNFFVYFTDEDALGVANEGETEYLTTDKKNGIQKKLSLVEHQLEICNKEKVLLIKENEYLKEINQLLKDKKAKKKI